MNDTSENRLETESIEIDFPHWMADELERKAAQVGVTSQDLVKYWISERLDKIR